jgi:hypothetical protein
MPKKIFAALLLLLLTFPAQGQENRTFDPSKSDPQALRIVDELWQALGGKAAWEQARYFSFHWIVEREGKPVADYRHDWDRYTGRYRVEGANREGKHFVALFNVNTREGEVYLEGEKLPTDSTKIKFLENAYARFINDSYWLIMPYKLNDPGVILNYDGEKELAEQKYDVVKVTFENVGLTPKDTYWAYISKTDRLMHRWEYVLQGQEPGTAPQPSWWRDWQTVGGIKLAMSKEFESRPARIYFKDVKVSPTVDEAVFEMTGKTF